MQYQYPQADWGVRRSPEALRLRWRALNRASARRRWATLLDPVAPNMRALLVAGLCVAAACGARMWTEVVEDGSINIAVILRAAVVSGLVVGGLVLQASPSRRRIGRMLLAAAIIPALAVFNALAHMVAFSTSPLAFSLTPAVLACLMLASPSGEIEDRIERVFAAFALGLATTVTMVGLTVSHDVALSWVTRGSTLAVTAGTAALMVRRVRLAGPRRRSLLLPMMIVAVLYAAVVAAYVVACVVGAGAAKSGFEIANLATALAIPLAILVGLAAERASLGNTLATFVAGVSNGQAGDVQAAVADTLSDPRLQFYYRESPTAEFRDEAGRGGAPAADASRRQAMVEGRGGFAAIVDYDVRLAGHEQFLRAATATALLSVQRERLAADLGAAKASLEASRLRLSKAADDERRKIQRDLHDGAQQHLIAMHIKLELALEAIEAEPVRSAALLADVGAALDNTARDLRTLASEVYPPTLGEYGLVDALASAIRTMGLAVHLEACAVGRHGPAVEAQIYFVCLEGLQNIAKHCGPDVPASLRLFASSSQLLFELRDAGPGFDRQEVGDGLGLHNMVDRIASVGGWLTIAAEPGQGTTLRGVVPTRPVAPA